MIFSYLSFFSIPFHVQISNVKSLLYSNFIPILLYFKSYTEVIETEYYKNLIKTLENQLAKIDSKLNTLPDGELLVYPNKDCYRWFYKLDNNKRIYLPKSKMEYARKLALKKSLFLQRKIIQAKIEGLNNSISILSSAEAEYLSFKNNQGYALLLEDAPASPNDIDLIRWSKSSYNKNHKYPEQLTYTCPSGNTVRSKSEVFIDMVINQKRFPYRYEAELILDNETFYPDFTILHPTTKKLIYWEHLGMMDTPEYSRKAFFKLQKYCCHGIIPGDNLILTYESKGNPFSFSDAEKALATLKA